MPLHEDEAQDVRGQAMWEDFLAQLPPEFLGDPEAFLEAFHAVEAKTRELQRYRDFYHGAYLGWVQSPDFQAYQHYLAAQEPLERPQVESDRLSRMLAASEDLAHGERQAIEADRQRWEDLGALDDDESHQNPE